MGDPLITALLKENHHPSTHLSMDSSSHDELSLDICPPNINLPLPPSPPTQLWTNDRCDIIEAFPKTVKKCTKRADSIWGAWFFFSFYFKPVLNEKSKAKRIVRDGNGIASSAFEKSDLQLGTFMVQHDMENMYMWAFKKKPENALGKMQLRSYMNGHNRQGVKPFPFSVDRGFVRSHRMQRKHYRGLSNPQCLHGVEVVPSPSLADVSEEDRRKWMELTGRDLNFVIPPNASDYSSWRNLPCSTEFELLKGKANDGCALNLSIHDNNKRKMDDFQPIWSKEVSGVLRNANGPVTAAKAIYEDEKGYLIVISLPFVDIERVRVSWKNDGARARGVVKVCCVSVARAAVVERQGRTFRLAGSPEHCPPGEFVREIELPTRIPEDAEIEASYDGFGSVLEVLVPKFGQGPEEREVRVCLR